MRLRDPEWKSYFRLIVLGKLILNGDLKLASQARGRFSVRPGTLGPKGGIKVVYTPAP